MRSTWLFLPLAVAFSLAGVFVSYHLLMKHVGGGGSEWFDAVCEGGEGSNVLLIQRTPSAMPPSCDLRGQVQVPGVYLTMEEISSMPAEFDKPVPEVLHYVRFLGYPSLVLMIAFVADRRFARGYRLAQRRIAAKLDVRSI